MCEKKLYTLNCQYTQLKSLHTNVSHNLEKSLYKQHMKSDFERDWLHTDFV